MLGRWKRANRRETFLRCVFTLLSLERSWWRRRISGIRREGIPESWTNKEEALLPMYDRTYKKNEWIRRSADKMRRKWKNNCKEMWVDDYFVSVFTSGVASNFALRRISKVDPISPSSPIWLENGSPLGFLYPGSSSCGPCWLIVTPLVFTVPYQNFRRSLWSSHVANKLNSLRIHLIQFSYFV